MLATEGEKLHITGSMAYAFYACDYLSELDLNMINVEGATSLTGVFEYCRLLYHLDLTGWKVTSKCTALNGLFHECRVLRFDDIPLETWDISNVTTLSGMFNTCYNLKKVDMSAWNPAKVTTMNSMFNYCRNLESVVMPLNPAPKLTDTTSLFYQCTNLSGELDLSSLDPDCIVTCSSMFNTCVHLEKINLGDMKVVTNTTSTNSGVVNMFSACYSLKEIVWDMSRCDFTKGASVNGFYSNCYNLQTPLDWSFFHGLEYATSFTPWGNCYKVPSITLSDDISFPKLTSLASTFSGCHSLKKIDISGMSFSTPITRLDSMFSNCRCLEEVILPEIDTSRVTTMASMFNGCYRLKKVPDALKSCDMTSCTTVASMFTEAMSLEEADLSRWTNMRPAAVTYIFSGCICLQRINVSGWDTTALSGGQSGPFSGIVYNYLNQSGWTASLTALIPDCSVLVEWYPPAI